MTTATQAALDVPAQKELEFLREDIFEATHRLELVRSQLRDVKEGIAAGGRGAVSAEEIGRLFTFAAECRNPAQSLADDLNAIVEHDLFGLHLEALNRGAPRADDRE